MNWYLIFKKKWTRLPTFSKCHCYLKTNLTLNFKLDCHGKTIGFNFPFIYFAVKACLADMWTVLVYELINLDIWSFICFNQLIIWIVFFHRIFDQLVTCIILSWNTNIYIKDLFFILRNENNSNIKCYWLMSNHKK